MPVDGTTIELRDCFFTERESILARTPGLTASTFRYPSGVAALRLTNQMGEMIVLPFQGQQIWDAEFHGRRLTMGSMFTEPVQTRDYLGNYGGFLLHCGVTAMGNPGPDDDHPLHGELPNAPYQRATLRISEDSGGPFMELAGGYRHVAAFSHNYEASPVLRLRCGDARIGLSFTVRNLKRTPMDFMYLAHVNFRPVDRARIVDTVPDNSEAIRLRTSLPEIFAPAPEHARLIETLGADISLHRRIEPGQTIDPELVMGLSCLADPDGWAHAMQLLPDGSADFVSHRPAELSHAVRWMTRTGDQDALGLVLPATAEADGYTAEKAKGNVRSLAPGAAFSAEIEFGALAPDEAGALQQRISDVMKRSG